MKKLSLKVMLSLLFANVCTIGMTAQSNLAEYEYELAPNLVRLGVPVEIINITPGEEVFIYDQNGALISSQVMDIDKQLYTVDLESGTYFLRTEVLYLKLTVI